MIELIIENRFQELKEKLAYSTDNFAIHDFLLEVLNNRSVEIDGESFNATKYQEEFFEGLEIFKALCKSNIAASQLIEYQNILVILTFKMAGFIQMLANSTMQSGIYLSQVEDAYMVNPALRDKIQEFIDLLKDRGEVKATANVAAAKAKVSTSVQDLLVKEEIGRDMLQFAESYANAGQTEPAIQIYKGIINDFEAGSVNYQAASSPKYARLTSGQKQK